jgi:hypothetical protein
MKKTGHCLCIVIVLLITALTAYGQMYVGNKYGCNIASQWGDEKIFFTESMMPGFVGGFWFQAQLFQSIILQPEMLISFKGRKSDTSDSNDLYLCYLEMPVLIKYTIIDSIIVVSAYSGIYFSLALSGFMQSPHTHEYVTLIEELPVFDIGLTGGSDISITIGSLFFSLDLRFTLGVIPTLNIEKFRNIVFTPFLCYGMKL